MLPLPFGNDDDDNVQAERSGTRPPTSDDGFFAPSLCRQKSFEGLMAGFLGKATPKKSGLREKQQEEEQARAEQEGRALPERGSLGRSLSVEDLGVEDGGAEPHKPRRGRRPERHGEATGAAASSTDDNLEQQQDMEQD